MRTTLTVCLAIGTFQFAFSLFAYAADVAPAAQLQAESPFEREKFEFEKSNEKQKAKYDLLQAIIAGVALAAPILVGICTLRAQNRSAFELKAAEIVMNAPNPYAVKRKAQVLQALFPKRLPPEFVESFEPEKFVHVGPSTESKMQLLKLIVEHPGHQEQIVDLWQRMFPRDPLDELFPGGYRKP